MAFKPINTQEEFDAAISARLLREREANTKKYGDYDELKSKVEGYEKQLAEYATQVETLTTELTNSRIETARMEVAAEHGLPMELAYRLAGNTKGELDADARRIVRSVAQIHREQPAPLRSSEPETVDPLRAGLREMIAKMGNE